MMSQPLLVYDGDCAFCTRCVIWIRRRMRHHPDIAPWQEADLEALGLTEARCAAALQFVDQRGRISSGERAVARTLLHAGGAWRILGGLILVPGIRHVAGLVYRTVARNRHRLPGGTAQCKIPESAPPVGMENPGDRG